MSKVVCLVRNLIVVTKIDTEIEQESAIGGQEGDKQASP
jgi:hypothetical protein